MIANLHLKNQYLQEMDKMINLDHEGQMMMMMEQSLFYSWVLADMN